MKQGVASEPENEDFFVSSKTADGRRLYPLWYQDLLIGAWGEGFYEKQPNFGLIFVKRRRNYLLVTFDNLSSVNDRSPNREPWACKFARDNDISHLGVTINSPNWFRDAWLIKRFRKLAREKFFEGYERVLFAGTSMGAFASLTFSQLVPNAHVAAFNPQTTLDPEIVPWETRFQAGRRQDWTLPLADGSKGLRKLGKVSVFYDPLFELDKMHADRIEGRNVTKLHCRMSGHKSALFLNRMGRLPDVMQALMFDDLNETKFYQMYRDRRRLYWFRNSLKAYFEPKGRTETVKQLEAAFIANKRRPATVELKPDADEST